jgi:hypothetical protein
MSKIKVPEPEEEFFKKIYQECRIALQEQNIPHLPRILYYHGEWDDYSLRALKQFCQLNNIHLIEDMSRLGPEQVKLIDLRLGIVKSVLARYGLNFFFNLNIKLFQDWSILMLNEGQVTNFSESLDKQYIDYFDNKAHKEILKVLGVIDIHPILAIVKEAFHAEERWLDKLKHIIITNKD